MEGIKMKTALVLGAGGFIGNHMVRRLKSEGYWVRGADLKHPDFSISSADHFVIADLSVYENVESVIDPMGIEAFDEIYQFAAGSRIVTGKQKSGCFRSAPLTQ